MTAVGGVIDGQLADLTSLHPDAEAIARPDGTTLVRVPCVALPAGWSKRAARLSFIVPVGFPMARPDCFWVDQDLRLAGGGMPANSGIQAIPGTPETALWFSWHLNAWDPARDTLLTYLRVMQERLARVQ